MKRIVLPLLLAAGSVNAASFDCNKARTFVEKAICADATLGKLDEAMEKNYGGSLVTDIGAQPRRHLQRSQRTWLKTRDRCRTNACIEQAYRQRIDALCEYPAITGVNWGCAVTSDEIK